MGTGETITGAPDITEQLRRNTVIAAAGRFEEHPESYRPRVFCRTEHHAGKVYEILQDGQAVVWPKAPERDRVTFDFWLIDVDTLKDINITRVK